MPRRTIGPFPGLQGLINLDTEASDPSAVLERADLINSVLAEAGCHCNGHSLGQQRDPYFGADLSEIVARCSPHAVTGKGDGGDRITRTVHIRIDTLRVVIDSNNEICAWVYEEY